MGSIILPMHEKRAFFAFGVKAPETSRIGAENRA